MGARVAARLLAAGYQEQVWFPDPGLAQALTSLHRQR